MWFILSAILIILVLILTGRSHKKLNLPPGPSSLPVVGYLPWIDAKSPHLSLTKLSRSYGDVCGLWMGSVYTVLLSDPKLVRQALSRDSFAGRAPLYVTHGIMRGYGLVCAEGEHWRVQRRFVASTLKSLGMLKHGDRRDKMEERILRFVEGLTAKWRTGDKERGVDPLEALHHSVGNLMNLLVFGKVYEEDNKTWRWLRHLQEDGVKHLGVAGPLNFLPFLRYLPRYRRMMRFLVDGKLQTHEEYARIIAEFEEKGGDGDHFIAAFLAEAKRRGEDVGSFSEQQFYHLLADIFGAGTDTTLTTLRWFLLFVAVHRKEQRKIHQEMLEVLGSRRVGLEDRGRLVYLEAAICEVQRIRSVVPVGIPHGTTEDTKIGEFDVPRGTMVVPLQWAIHMDERFWEEPEKFKPARFVSEEGLRRPEAFIPFQMGKRMCVGEELARMILFLFAGRIVQSFRILVPEGQAVDLEGECGITLVPREHRLVFLER